MRCCRFALPALLPLISPDLELTDTQGSLLTMGYTVSPAASSVAWLGACASLATCTGGHSHTCRPLHTCCHVCTVSWQHLMALHLLQRCVSPSPCRGVLLRGPAASPAPCCRCCTQLCWCPWASWQTRATGPACWQGAWRAGASSQWLAPRCALGRCWGPTC